MLRGSPSDPHFFRKLRQKMNHVSFLPKNGIHPKFSTFIPKLKGVFVTNLRSCPYFVKKLSPKYEKPYLYAACITRFDTHIVSNSHQHQAVIAPHAGAWIETLPSAAMMVGLSRPSPCDGVPSTINAPQPTGDLGLPHLHRRTFKT
jgi:hypothetical protein